MHWNELSFENKEGGQKWTIYLYDIPSPDHLDWEKEKIAFSNQ